MKHLVLSLTAVFLLCFSSNASAGKSGFYQQAQADTVPKKVRITVKDLMDGTALDSVFVSIGSKKGLTNNKGIIEFDSIPAGNMVVATKAGYLAQSKKAKAEMQMRLSKREFQQQ